MIQVVLNGEMLASAEKTPVVEGNVYLPPSSVLGAVIGTRWQGRIPEDVSRRFFGFLFPAIGAVFVLAFTVFEGRFA